MGQTDNKNLIRAFYAAGERGDLESCMGMLADDIRWTNIGTTVFSGTFEGKQDLVDNLLGPLFGQLRAGISTTIENLFAEGDYVIAQTRGSAETVTGQPYNNSYCQIIRIADGRIAEVMEYFDTELASRVLERT